jgi:hypothetical protein
MFKELMKYFSLLYTRGFKEHEGAHVSRAYEVL